MRVHVLATCRREDLLPYSTLVFKTLRVGFPTADVLVYLNGLKPDSEWGMEIRRSAGDVGAEVFECPATIHHEFIFKLLCDETEAFWLLDTDVMFYGSVEHLKFDAPLAGFRVPEFVDESCGAITRARLHTSLLYVDPKKIETALSEYTSKLHYTPFTPQINLINPVVLPWKRKAYFYDTMALLYHAVGGEAFSDEVKELYFHFHSGTISDLVVPRLRESEKMMWARSAIMGNPHIGKGKWRFQEAWYAERQP